MRIKSFIASTVQEALISVKREMGEASIILETRNIEEGDIKSKPGQTLVEVVAAENNKRQRSDQNEEHKEGQDAQDDNADPDLQSQGQNKADSSPSDLQQSEQHSSTTEHKNILENHLDSVILSDHLHSDNLPEPADSTSADRLSDFSDTAPSGKVRQASKWIVGSMAENSIQHEDHDIKNSGDNSNLLSSDLNQSVSTPSELYSSVKKQNGLSRDEKDSVTLSDHLLAEDLIEMAGYTPDEISAAFGHQQSCETSGDWTEVSEKLFKQLRIQQVEEEHSRLLIDEVLCRLSRDEHDKMDLHLQMLRDSIAHKIRISDSSSNNRDECKTMVFVGTAGTGKTTTILKLASEAKKRSDKKILLISIRGHSSEKLKKTAARIGATLRTVTSHRELRDIIDKYEASTHIFIDTPGISYRDDNALSGLRGFLDEMPNMVTHLVVSAATRYDDIIKIVNKFSLFPIHRLHFTKVDETCLYGTLFSVAMETQIPLSYISDGQEVPEDLRPITAEMVADMVLQI
ncbi:MAG: flagellar biosynthesis protein FlhF [Candidatus Scalindua sp.]